MTMRLRTLLGDHPGTSALKDGSLKSDLVAFDFAVYSPTNKGFKPMVREQGILASEYGVDVDAINWVTFEDAHVAEYVDTTERAPAGRQIIQMLLDGELDAVLGEKVEEAGLRPLFPDVAAEEKSWFAKYGVLPINHMVVVSQDLADHHPDEVREVFHLLRESAARAPAAAVPQFSADEMRRSLEMIIRYAAQQRLIPRAFAAEELFNDRTGTLGAIG